MTRDPARELIDRLAADLEPVRAMAPLAVSLLALLGVGVALGVAVLSVYAPRPGLWDSIVGNPTYASVLVGLGLAALGGCLGTLASVIPGREALVRTGMAGAVVGLLLAVAGAAATIPWAEVSLASLRGQHLGCLVRGAVFAVVPVLAALYAATRGWSGRPELTACLTLIGAGALGALLVHLTCPASDPLHVLCTHVATPLVLAALLTLALLPAVRHWAR